MSRELAYISTIGNIFPIKDADRIEVAQILGWEVVVAKKDNLKIGDKVVYIEIDAILPKIECFKFMEPRNYRVKTIRLKKQISQGICFPLSILKEINSDIDISKFKDGDPLTEIIGITKHDPEAAFDVKRIVIKKSWLQRKISYLKWKLFSYKPKENNDFPEEIPKTDETRVQHMSGLLERNAGKQTYISEKCEGTSSTFVFQKTSGNWLAKLFNKDNLFLVCSRNRVVWSSDIGGDSKHNIYYVAKKYDIFNKLKILGRNIAIQGEVIGCRKDGSNKIQGNIYSLSDLELRVFLIYDLDKKIYLPFEEIVELSKILNLTIVPIIDFDHDLINDIKYYVELSKENSIINTKVKREGIVIRSKDCSFSFKSINPEYLLNNEINK